MIVSSYYTQKKFNRLYDTFINDDNHIEDQLCLKNDLNDVRINESDESIFILNYLNMIVLFV